MVFVGTITAALVIKFVVKIFVSVLLSFIDAVFLQICFRHLAGRCVRRIGRVMNRPRWVGVLAG